MRGVTLTADTSRATLVRDLRRSDLVALTVNNVIGAGVFTMPAALAAGRAASGWGGVRGGGGWGGGVALLKGPRPPGGRAPGFGLFRHPANALPRSGAGGLGGARLCGFLACGGFEPEGGRAGEVGPR